MTSVVWYSNTPPLTCNRVTAETLKDIARNKPWTGEIHNRITMAVRTEIATDLDSDITESAVKFKMNCMLTIYVVMIYIIYICGTPKIHAIKTVLHCSHFGGANMFQFLL